MATPQQFILQIQQLEHEKKALQKTCMEQFNAILGERVVIAKFETMLQERQSVIQQLQKQIENLKTPPEDPSAPAQDVKSKEENGK